MDPGVWRMLVARIEEDWTRGRGDGYSRVGVNNYQILRGDMKKILTVLAVMAAVAATGCQENAKQPDGTQPGAAVKLPPDVAGIWQEEVDEGIPWALLVTEDGQLEEARLALAAAIVRPGETTKTKMRDGQYSTFETGPAVVTYNPETRELAVALDVKHFQVLYGEERIEGSARYAFTGPVSEDGQHWNTIFAEQFDYGPRFPMDPNGIGVPMSFRKLKTPQGG